MTRGLFEYPPQAAFGRVVPKSKVFAFGKVNRRLKELFATEIERIEWRFKLAPETTNMPAGPGVAEIQVFGIALKPGVAEMSEDILRCIDNAIAFPIVFEVLAPATNGDRVKVISVYKRPSEADSNRWVVGEYFSTTWLATDTVRSSLPVALDLAGLYDQILRQLMPAAGRPGETLQQLAQRHRLLAVKQREVAALKKELKREKQFSRKVKINGLLREASAVVDALTNGDSSGG
jgi:hypothetical protein